MSLIDSFDAMPPEEEYARKKGLVNRHDEESAARKRSFEEKLERDKAEREVCMKNAADHAGAIGLVYSASDNNYYRIVSDIEEVAPPVAPEPPTPPQLPAMPRARDIVRSSAARSSKVMDVLGWVLSIPVGLFVGYGLASLTGLPIQRQPIYLVVGILVGIAAIIAIKLVFDKFWKHVGREKAMNRPYLWSAALATFITLFLVFVEAWLGAQALVMYSKRVVFDQNDALSQSTALPLAIAVSTATLLLSAISGFVKGADSLSEHDEEMRDYDLQVKAHDKEVERQQAVYRDQLSRWEQLKNEQKSAHEEQLSRMEIEKQEMDHYRKSADFQALLKYIGRINTLNVIIEESETSAKGDRISRGYEKASIK